MFAIKAYLFKYIYPKQVACNLQQLFAVAGINEVMVAQRALL
jgi:hypothetical protein